MIAQRLSAAGTPFDAAGVIAEIEQLNAKQAEDTKDAGTAETTGQDAKTAASSAPEAAIATSVGPNGEIWTPAVDTAAMSAAQRKLSAVSDVAVGRTVIKLKTLQPKLDKCVVRAKV